MIDNYNIMPNGVIKQINVNKIKYDINYVNDRYNQYNDKVVNMSHLRLGNIIGSIGRIPKSILDVGYGNGGFLEISKTIIPNCYGNDISDYMLPDGCIYVDNILIGMYDVVTFFDSLEHFDDINFVKDINCNYICISVPNCHNFNDDWFFEWKHRRSDEHLYHFNEHSLVHYMNEMGYSLINSSNIEDIIRTNNQIYSNILTCIFKKDE